VVNGRGRSFALLTTHCSEGLLLSEFGLVSAFPKAIQNRLLLSYAMTVTLLVLIGYIAFDPRERVLLFVPVMDQTWQDPLATAEKYTGDNWIYPVSMLPISAFYENDFVAVWVTGSKVAGELSEGFDADTRTAYRSGLPFFISITKKSANVEVDVEQLEVLDPCGPEPIGDLSEKPQFKVLHYTYEPPPCSVCIRFLDDQSQDGSTARESEKVFIVLQGTELRECAVGFREAIKLPAGQEVPNLKFRTIPWLYVRYPEGAVIP